MGLSSPAADGHLPELEALETSALPVTGVVSHYPAQHAVPQHRHRRGHLLYAADGVLLVEAATGRWLVPPTAAVWLRPGVLHRLFMPQPVRVHCIFIDEQTAVDLPANDCVLQVSALRRELIDAVSRLDGEQHKEQKQQARRVSLLGQLLLEELGSQPALPFHLPWPADMQMQRVCDALVQDPGGHIDAEEWAGQLAMSTKTFHRHFQKSTGLTFGKWRQQMRLMSSLTMLLEGAPVIQAALSSGYESHSAYTVAFKKHFACSPSAFAMRAAAGD